MKLISFRHKKRGRLSCRIRSWSVLEQGARSGAPLRVTLTELGHTQPLTPLHMDNSTAFRILIETIKQKRSKAMDMRYQWLTDRVRQNNLTFIGDQDVKISEIITQNIIQRNITKICAD
jgi:hypothetical protein